MCSLGWSVTVSGSWGFSEEDQRPPGSFVDWRATMRLVLEPTRWRSLAAWACLVLVALLLLTRAAAEPPALKQLASGPGGRQFLRRTSPPTGIFIPSHGERRGGGSRRWPWGPEMC